MHYKSTIRDKVTLIADASSKFALHSSICHIIHLAVSKEYKILNVCDKLEEVGNGDEIPLSSLDDIEIDCDSFPHNPSTVFDALDDQSKAHLISIPHDHLSTLSIC